MLTFLSAHVCLVFAIHGEKMKESTVQEFIDHKLATIRDGLKNSSS